MSGCHLFGRQFLKHTKGALGEKSVGPFPPWGPLSTRRQKEPMPNVCDFSILLIRTELSDTQDILPSRTQSRLWLSHTDAILLLKASSLALQTRAASFEVLLWRGEVSAVIGPLWRTLLSKEVSFTVRRAALCRCPKKQHESQLYGNGCQQGGGALTNRCLNQSCSA